MSENMANAYPKKRFFIDMFTKDISMEACILDLIDNSIDGLIRSTNLTPEMMSKRIFGKKGSGVPREEIPSIDVKYSASSIEITDNCGGIDEDYAQKEAFNFGHSVDWSEGHLGVYGIGLKRALFKLGDKFEIESHTTKNGFHCSLEVRKWLKKDESMEDWRIPIESRGKAAAGKAGTSIKISRLHKEVKLRLKDGLLAASLRKKIAVTYAFFLGDYVNVTVNGRVIEPFDIPLGQAKGGKVSFEEFESQDGVKVRIYASVSSADDRGRWSGERAGWYVACNGRIVLDADQSDISGWGVSPTPKYHPKYRQFIGLVFFESSDPHKLPWTTTKRGLNRESAVYLRVRNKMATACEPVLQYLSDLYAATPDDEEPTDKRIADVVQRVSVSDATSKKATRFKPPTKDKKTKTRVQFDVEKSELDAVYKHIRKRMTAAALGRFVFDYYLRQEGLK